MTDAKSLFDIFEELEMEDVAEESVPDGKRMILRAPFAWPGGKSRSLLRLLPLIPYGDRYIEPFGGSGIVLLNRKPSRLDVFNDAHSGITAFYRCLHDPDLLKQLLARLQYLIYSREEFVWCAETWQTHTDTIERAARWWYSIRTSFGSQGRNFGRVINQSTQLQKIQDLGTELTIVANRFKRVLVENLDFAECMTTFDDYNAVFYVDPPYYHAHNAAVYPTTPFKEQDHVRLLDLIFKCRGFIALSSDDNILYSERDWDDKFTWEARSTIQGWGIDLDSHKSAQTSPTNQIMREVLYVKHAR